MPLSRDDVRAAVERAGDEHWQSLIRHHEDPYPRPAPTPGDICREEAARLNALGLGIDPRFTLLETAVRRVGEEVELVHRYSLAPDPGVLQTAPFQNYAPDPA
ncbi:MAG: hypothetical protein ABI742_11840 [Gemmatimonadota bacterium]